MSAALRLLIAQLVIVLPLAVVTWLAVAYSLYWHYRWLDIPMHLFGGVWAALCGAWILAQRRQDFSVFWCLLFALIVGVGWEIFEYSEGIAIFNYMGTLAYQIDTAKDLSVDLLGAIAGWMLARQLVRNARSRPMV